MIETEKNLATCQEPTQTVYCYFKRKNKKYVHIVLYRNAIDTAPHVKVMEWSATPREVSWLKNESLPTCALKICFTCWSRWQNFSYCQHTATAVTILFLCFEPKFFFCNRILQTADKLTTDHQRSSIHMVLLWSCILFTSTFLCT